MTGGQPWPPEEVGVWLREPMLAGGAAAGFAAEVRRIGGRFRRWRQNFAAIGSLLDTEEQRAEALAGNYATEARVLLEAWVRAQVDQGGGRIDPRALAALHAWAGEFLARWRRAALREGPPGPWPEEVRGRFGEVLDDLLGRARAEVTAALHRAARPRLRGLALVGAGLRRALTALGDWLGRLFWPRP